MKSLKNYSSTSLDLYLVGPSDAFALTEAPSPAYEDVK